MEAPNQDQKYKIRAFTDLAVWREAHNLVVMTYKITRTFPQEEIFGITSQMRRSAVSVTSNIAEGFARMGGKEKIRFYVVARGSLVELESQLLVARDVDYISVGDFENIYEQLNIVHRLLNAFINKTNNL